MPFTVTNKGIHLNLPLRSLELEKRYTAVLDCEVIGKNRQFLGIWLKDVSDDSDYRDNHNPKYFERDRSDRLEMVDMESMVLI